MANPKKKSLPKELENVAYTDDVNAIDEKVERCYSQDRYEEFQEAVEKIVLKKIGSEDGGEKIKKHAGDYFQSKFGWVVFIWVVTLIVSMLLQKFLNVL